MTVNQWQKSRGYRLIVGIAVDVDVVPSFDSIKKYVLTFFLLQSITFYHFSCPSRDNSRQPHGNDYLDL